MYGALKRPDDARNAFEQALSADAKSLPAHFTLGEFFIEQRQWKELAAISERAVELDSAQPSAHLHHAIAHLNLGNLEAAEKSAWQAQALDKERRLPAVELTLGLILDKKGDYAGAAEHLRTYLERAPGAANADAVREHLKNAERRQR